MPDGAIAQEIKPDFGPRPELTWLPVKLLSVDPTYQRTLDSRRSERAICQIVEKFRWACFGTVLVCPCEDGWRIIDGQHRVEAAKRLGIATVPCIVVPEASVAEQASIFLSTNLTRVSVNIYALFHARIAAGEPVALATVELCKQALLTIPRYPIPASSLKPGHTLALRTLEGAAKSADPIDRQAVIAVGSAYVDQKGGGSANILQGVILAAKTAPSELIAIGGWLRRHSPEQLMAQYGTAAALADIILRGVSKATAVKEAPWASLVSAKKILPAPPSANSSPAVARPVDPLQAVVTWMDAVGMDVVFKGDTYLMNGRIRMSAETLLESANRRRRSKGLALFSETGQLV